MSDTSLTEVSERLETKSAGAWLGDGLLAMPPGRPGGNVMARVPLLHQRLAATYVSHAAAISWWLLVEFCATLITGASRWLLRRSREANNRKLGLVVEAY